MSTAGHRLCIDRLEKFYFIKTIQHKKYGTPTLFLWLSALLWCAFSPLLCDVPHHTRSHPVPGRTGLHAFLKHFKEKFIIKNSFYINYQLYQRSFFFHYFSYFLLQNSQIKLMYWLEKGKKNWTKYQNQLFSQVETISSCSMSISSSSMFASASSSLSLPPFSLSLSLSSLLSCRLARFRDFFIETDSSNFETWKRNFVGIFENGENFFTIFFYKITLFFTQNFNQLRIKQAIFTTQWRNLCGVSTILWSKNVKYLSRMLVCCFN